MNPTTDFPENFLWGTATAAHQVEGNNTNSDLWVLEHLPDTIFAEPSGDAIDHYHRYADDIAMLSELGFNSYRFSIEWARVEPEEGYFSMAILDHYCRMCETCHKHGLKPVVTYHHFTSPRWLISQGGWYEVETAEKFANYCRKVTQHCGDLIGAVCTINEINIPRMAALVWMSGDEVDEKRARFMAQAAQAFQIPPERLGVFMFAGTDQARDITIAAHQQARKAIKSEQPSLPVGLTIAMQDLQAIDGGQGFRDEMRRELQDIFLEVARDDDFVGVQTYSRERYSLEGRLEPEEGIELTQMGYEYWPQAIEATLRYAHQVAGVPLMVTENGLGSQDDTRRLAYFQTALQCVADCLQEGLDIRGYFAWSAFDNFEWMFGYRPQFGIISVNRDTQKRRIKPSAHWLGEVAKTNRLG
jgi:beta-glucosidase